MYEIGTFLAEIEGATLTTARTGTDQVMVEFRFIEGPNTGSRITEYLALTEKALPYTVKKLRACGLPNDDLEKVAETVGNEVELVLKVESGNDGVERARVAFINKPGSRGKPADPAAAAGVASRWKSKIAELPKEEAAPDPFDR